jgi:hypothetical protein
MRRFSIRSLMAFVLACALGMAALRNANEFWAGAMIMVALAAVGTAVLGALTLRGADRYGWAGFAVFSGGYLVIAVGPWPSDSFKPQLGTTALLTYVRARAADTLTSPTESLPGLQLRRAQLVQQIEAFAAVTRDSFDPALVELKKRLANVDIAIQRAIAGGPSASPWRALRPGAMHVAHFFCVGHSLFSLLAGLVGTAVARGFYARRLRAELPAVASDDAPPVGSHVV